MIPTAMRYDYIRIALRDSIRRSSKLEGAGFLEVFGLGEGQYLNKLSFVFVIMLDFMCFFPQK
jgi:hypothetical protein